MVDLQLTDGIKSLGISRISVTEDQIEVYNGSASVQSRLYKNSIDKTLLELQSKMVESKKFGDLSNVQKIVKLMSDSYVNAAETDGNGKNRDKQKQDKSESYSEVYKIEGFILAETIIVGRTPKFLIATLEGEADCKPRISFTIQDEMDASEKKVMKPFEESMCVDRPYVFKSQEELERVITDARKETLDTLYQKVKRIWKKYIAEDDKHLSLCAANCIYTYFQDKLGITHYIFLVGDNDSGKSNNLIIIYFLGYRNMLSSHLTAANIYSFLGTGNEGIGTICEDEAEDVDKDNEKMKIYKNGYTKGIKVHRLDLPQGGGRKQDAYNTFCFKAFAGEHRPDSSKAKGFNQRTVELPCTYNIPQYDVSEILNPAGDDTDQELLDELNNVRNSLLIYRILHFYDKIPNIKLNIQNREKQLFKPLLRLFQNTETFKELLPVISHFINEKRQAKSSTLTAYLSGFIPKLVEKYGSTISTTDIWNDFVAEFPDGEQIGKYTYNIEEFGEVSQKTLTSTLKDQLHAKPPKHKGSKNRLTFDIDRLRRMESKYNLDFMIKVINETSGDDGDDGEDVGLDKHFSSTDKDTENTDNAKKDVNNSNISSETNTEVDSDISPGSDQQNSNAPQHPQHPHSNNVNDFSNDVKTKKHQTYRRNDGFLGCRNCNIFGDRFRMEERPCSSKDEEPTI